MMISAHNKIIPLLFLLLLIWGCASPVGLADLAGDSAPSGQTPPTPTAIGIIPTAVIPYQDGGFWILPEGPRTPTDFGDALRQRIEASAEAGILAGLDYLLGEGEAAIFGTLPPATTETHGD